LVTHASVLPYNNEQPAASKFIPCAKNECAFDWNSFRTLLAVLEQGSLLGAARVLMLS
jgi:hypothetical protein